VFVIAKRNERQDAVLVALLGGRDALIAFPTWPDHLISREKRQQQGKLSVSQQLIKLPTVYSDRPGNGPGPNRPPDIVATHKMGAPLRTYGC